MSPTGVILAIACVAQFMVVLDVSIVNVALPSIGRDLHYSATGLQWVVNAYVLTFAGFLLLGGRAADLFGRRRVFVFGLALFTVASLAGGVAQTRPGSRRPGRSRAIGGALLSPATLTIIVTTFPPRAPGPGARHLERRGRAPAAPPARSSAASSPRRCPGAGCCSSTSRSGWPRSSPPYRG